MQRRKENFFECLCVLASSLAPLRGRYVVLVLRHFEAGDEGFGVVSEAHAVDAVG